MKPAPLTYLRPRTKAEALEQLAETGEDARLLAGGQSLVPMLNLRIAQPSHLLDIGRLDELDRLGVLGDEFVIGALVRHHVLERHPLVRQHAPLMAVAASHIGHPAIRHRGTLGGSLAHADPSGELLAVAMLLDATIVVESCVAGTRKVAAREFVAGPYETVLAPDEMVTWLRIRVGRRGRTGFHEIARQPGAFAIAGAAVHLPRHGDPGPAVAVTFGPAGPRLTSAGSQEAAADPAGLSALLHPSAGGDPGAQLPRVAIERAIRAAEPMMKDGDDHA